MTRDRVLELHALGLPGRQIAARLGLSKSTVAYHLRRLGEPPDARFNRRYDWQVVQAYYDAGHSVSQCVEHFGFARKTFFDACLRGAIATRPQAMPIEQLLAAPRTRTHLKMRLIGAGLLVTCCHECGISDWRGRPLSLALHHVNGDGRDNRVENLQLLCPKCHSQTENFAGRNCRRTAGGGSARAAATLPAATGVRAWMRQGRASSPRSVAGSVR